MADIKEIKELLAGIKVLGIAAKKVAKDGKISAEDLSVLLPLAQQSEVLLKAFEGIKDIKDEAKDLSLAEAQELISEILLIIKEVKEA